LLIGIVLAVYLGIALTAWIRLRGTRVVTWLATCSRWPERGGCDQACVPQIVEAGDEARATAMAAHFFEGQRCAICQHSIDGVNASMLPPGLLDPVTHDTFAWDEIAAQELPDAFRVHKPLCANCTLAESFRRRYPDRVVDRVARPGGISR
jgi:hypothetical protein